MARNQDSNYYRDREIKYRRKLAELVRFLPSFCVDFFVGIENNTSILTRVGYAYDLITFFEYLYTECFEFSGKNSKNFTIFDLNSVKSEQIEYYMNHLNYHERDGKVYTNSERAKARKLAAVRSFFKYLYNRNKIEQNVASKVAMPKLHDREIIRLEVDEVVKILNEAEYGDNLTSNQQSWHSKTRLRDTAILTLFLGTGIRVSELVGINISDINFDVNGFTIVRKGGNRVVLYFSDEVASAILAYIKDERPNHVGENSGDALFLSRQKTRMGVRAIENLIKKYAKIVSPMKKITPHKLRSTYGTSLYRATGDIYIVADVLGHSDVNTTKKHYAAISDDARRNAATQVKLRDKD